MEPAILAELRSYNPIDFSEDGSGELLVYPDMYRSLAIRSPPHMFLKIGD